MMTSKKLQFFKKDKLTIILLLSCVILGIATLMLSRASTSVASIEVESGNKCSSSMEQSNSGASLGKNIKFITNACGSDYVVSNWLTNEAIPVLNPAEGSWPIGSLGNFRFQCWASHLNYDDPIVYPGQQEAAHLHMFFGNRNLNHLTTTDNISKSGEGSCAGGPLNRTGYWIPALLDNNNKARIPFTITFYYKTQGIEKTSVQPYPTGLRMISGDMNATSSQNDWRIQWQCLDSSGNNIDPNTIYSVIPTCSVGNKLKLQFSFPQCGARNPDGTPKLDSPDHKSHMTYQPDNHVCPSSHPIPYPEVSLNMIWPVTGSPAQTWYLSSDHMNGVNKPGGTTTHADWMMGWNEQIMNTFINRCLREGRNSNQGNLCDGTRLKMISGPNGGEYTGAQVIDPPVNTSSQVNMLSAF